LRSVAFDLGKVGKRPVSRWLVLADDEIFSAQYFGKNLKGYWEKRRGNRRPAPAIRRGICRAVSALRKI